MFGADPPHSKPHANLVFWGQKEKVLLYNTPSATGVPIAQNGVPMRFREAPLP